MNRQKYSLKELFRLAQGKKAGCCEPEAAKGKSSASRNSSEKQGNCCQTGGNPAK